MKILNLILLSIIFLKCHNVCCISTREILREKRNEFQRYSEFIINEKNLVDNNEKIINNSIRTYKYYMEKGIKEIVAIFIFDDLNITKARELGIQNKTDHELNINNIQKNIQNIYPLDEINSFSDLIYKERKLFSFETEYSVTNYVFTKFVFHVKITEENDEEIMFLMINNELNMKEKNLEIIKKTNEYNNGNNNIPNVNSNSVNLYQKHPQAFVQFIGAIIGIATLVSSISGAVSGISSIFSSRPAPTPPEFLGDEKSKLSKYETGKKEVEKKDKKKKYYKEKDDAYDDYEYYDNEYYDDEYYEDEYYDDEYYDDEYYDDEYYDEYDDDY
ncbi:conserved Plasmodium protein, unknown function [Plasmodium sp. gorilla clade G3]|nr:conserved Plasmodium protein, unknown function [Plasmodium sp. gorilla clade G3]